MEPLIEGRMVIDRPRYRVSWSSRRSSAPPALDVVITAAEGIVLVMLNGDDWRLLGCTNPRSVVRAGDAQRLGSVGTDSAPASTVSGNDGLRIHGPENGVLSPLVWVLTGPT